MATALRPALTAAPSDYLTVDRLTAALVALCLGAALLYASGFAAPSLLHNAAHDWRHAHNFPCH